MRFLQQGEVVTFCHLQGGAIPVAGSVAIPEDREQGLVGGARDAVGAAHKLALVHVGGVLCTAERWRTAGAECFSRGNEPRCHVGKLRSCAGSESRRGRPPLANIRSAQEGRRIWSDAI